MQYLITGGGTGGHLYPGLAIAEILRKKEACTIVFVGTRHGLEAEVVPKKGYVFYQIWISGLHRRQFVKNLLFPLKMGVSLIQSMAIIKKIKPDVIIGTGGYVCWPVLTAAHWMRKKTVLQEQNQVPGLVIRLLAPYANRVFLSFDSSKSCFKKQDHLLVSGNPTRDDLEIGSTEKGIKLFNLNKNRITLFIFGGSQGASAINQGISQILPELLKMKIQVLWMTGSRAYKSIVNQFKNEPHVHMYPYIDEMGMAYHACDMVICRAGATTVAEITRMGLPSIVIPLPTAAHDHQKENAKALMEAGAAEMVCEGGNFNNRLYENVLKLIQNPQKRKEMSKRAKSLGKPYAATTIAHEIIQLSQG